MDMECAGAVNLNKYESKYRLFFECALDMVFFIDIDGRILDVNYAAIKEYGYSHDEFLSMNARDLRIPDERGKAEKQLHEAYEKGAIFETIHERKNGSTLPVEISSRGVIIDHERMLIAIVRDIAKRKEAEKNLSRLAAIVKSSDDAILGMTLDGIITEWNHGAETMYEYKASEIIGRSVAVLIPKNRPYELQNIIQVIGQGKSLEHYDTERVRKDGSTIFVSLTASPIKSRQGEVLGISWTARDITGHKRNEVELQRKALLLDLSPDAIIVRLSHGKITFWSKGAESLYGWTRKEAIGKNIYELLKTQFPMPLEQINQQLMETNYWSGELIHFTRDDRMITVESRWLARINPNGSIREILELNSDITECKRVEEELRARTKELEIRTEEMAFLTKELGQKNEALARAKNEADLYLDLMGHDINNMNQVAMGFLEIALESFNLTDEEKEFLEKPLDTLSNSSRLIENVRKLQKLGEGSLKNKKIDICDILQKVKKDYSHIPGREVTIHFTLVPHCYVIANDLIKDVFSNLVGNAIKHSDPHKPLTIDVKLEVGSQKGKDYYKVIVEDDGPGIPDALKNKLFMRFQRGDIKASGKGLGLFLVRTLVADFHGKIWVEDRVSGDHTKGVRFIVMLPASE